MVSVFSRLPALGSAPLSLGSSIPDLVIRETDPMRLTTRCDHQIGLQALIAQELVVEQGDLGIALATELLEIVDVVTTNSRTVSSHGSSMSRSQVMLVETLAQTS